MDFDLQTLSAVSFDVNQDLLKKLDANTEIVLSIDEFEDLKTIKFNKVGYGIEDNSSNGQDEYFKLYVREDLAAYDFLGFTFINHEGFTYLEVVLRGGDISLAKGDYLIILYDDGTKIKYTFQKASSGNKYMASNIIPLKSEDLLNFLTRNISKVKVVSSRKSIYGVYLVNEKKMPLHSYFKYKYTSREEGQLLLRYMTYKFIEFNLANKK